VGGSSKNEERGKSPGQGDGKNEIAGWGTELEKLSKRGGGWAQAGQMWPFHGKEKGGGGTVHIPTAVLLGRGRETWGGGERGETWREGSGRRLVTDSLVRRKLRGFVEEYWATTRKKGDRIEKEAF